MKIIEEQTTIYGSKRLNRDGAWFPFRKNPRARRAHRASWLALKNGYAGPVFGASALTAFTFCFLSFFARLAARAKRFLAVCFLRLLCSI